MTSVLRITQKSLGDMFVVLNWQADKHLKLKKIYTKIYYECIF